MAIKGRSDVKRPPGAMKKVMTLLENEGRGLVLSPPIPDDFKTLDLSNRRVEKPILDNSLPYIPVYTHLITYDPVPIERPLTPSVVKSLWAESRVESPIRKTPESKSSSRLEKTLTTRKEK